MRKADALTEIALQIIRKNECQHKRAQRNACDVQEDCQHTPEQHDEDIKLRVRNAEGADVADGQNHAVKEVIRNFEDQRKPSLKRNFQNKRNDRTHQYAGKHQIAEIRLLRHKQRTGL